MVCQMVFPTPVESASSRPRDAGGGNGTTRAHPPTAELPAGGGVAGNDPAGGGGVTDFFGAFSSAPVS